MARSPKGWHSEDIKAAIRKCGVTLTELGRRHGYSERAVSVALRQRWPAVEAIIAAFIGVEPQVLWPDRYDPEGRPLTSRNGRKDTRRRKRRHVQSAKKREPGEGPR